MSKLVNVVLHGQLGKKYAKHIELGAANVWQVMSFLKAHFGQEFVQDIREGNWHVFNGRRVRKNSLDEKELGTSLKERTLHIVPAVAGASAAVRVVAGVVLVTAGVVLGVGTGVGFFVAGVGMGLLTGGLMEMMIRTPKGNRSDSETESAPTHFTEASNVTTAGGPIPVLYGRWGRCSTVVIGSSFTSGNTR